VLLKSCLLIALYSVRSERQFCERLQYDLLFRFCLDLGLDEDAFDASSFAKNKTRLLEADVARLFFEGVVQQAKAGRLLSADHFTVDGTLLEAWASLKSFRPKDEQSGNRRPPDDPGNPTPSTSRGATLECDPLVADGLGRAPHSEAARGRRRSWPSPSMC
jgi:Transposase domain (DUF772)